MVNSAEIFCVTTVVHSAMLTEIPRQVKIHQKKLRIPSIENVAATIKFISDVSAIYFHTGSEYNEIKPRVKEKSYFKC